MKKSYVPITLDAYLNESKSIMLKRGYGQRQPVVVGTNAPLRDKVLTYVSENRKVSKTDLKRFIAGLNEGSKNPIASATMWLQRNSKFFITESKNGITYYKLSNIGQRLFKRADVSNLSEELKQIRRRINEETPHFTERFEKDFEEDFDEDGKYDFVDRSKGYARPGIYDEMDECSVNEEDDDVNELDEAAKLRIKRIIENIRSKRNKKLYEEKEEDDEEQEEVSDDELSFDDLDFGDELEGDDDELEGDDDELEGDDDELEGDESDDKVEITEFIITVDDVEDAISELEELEVTAEQVVDEEGEPIENQIKVSADDWEPLRGWLEEKGVDIEEMFGGEIEVEDEIDLEKTDDEEGEDLELDDDTALDFGEKEDFDLKDDGFEFDEDDLDDNEPKEDEMEESVTGMEREERQKTPNLVSGKEVTITIK